MDRDLGFVLKLTPFRERDLIAVLLTETRGKISVVARNGIQSRRFGSSLDLFLASEFVLDPKSVAAPSSREDDLIPIQSAQTRHSLRSITHHLEKLAAGSCLNEVLIKTVVPGRPATEMFRLYSNTLLALDENPPEQAVSILNGFLLKFTQWLGVQPLLTRCHSCGQTLNEITSDLVHPLITQGSWVCLTCRGSESSALTLTRLALQDAVLAMTQPIRKRSVSAPPQDHFELLEYLEKHLAFCVPGFEKQELSSIRFLKSIRSQI